MGKWNTREKLLEAGLKLFSESGYQGATTREIAQEAGFTELTLFRHFGSKEHLFEEVLERYSFLAKIRALRPQLEGLPYEQALHVLGVDFLKTLKERKSLVTILLSEVHRHPGRISVFYQRMVDEIIHVLSGYFGYLQGKGLLRTFPVEIGARAFLGMIFSYFRSEEIVKGKDLPEEEIESIVREFVYIFVHGTLRRQ